MRVQLAVFCVRESNVAVYGAVRVSLRAKARKVRTSTSVCAFDECSIWEWTNKRRSQEEDVVICQLD